MLDCKKLKIMVLFTLFSGSAFCGNKIAIVKIVKGEVHHVLEDKTETLALEEWIEEGSLIKTGQKSFVKLIFIDKSHLNIAPNSEVKIENFSGKEVGVIDMVKGKIRSQVTKDYLQMNTDKSKLFIKTPHAVLGIRGTDFLVTTNKNTTSTILFEGEVAFNNLPSNIKINTTKLEDIVDRGVRIMPGEFSVVEGDKSWPTVPAVLNVKQREVLEALGHPDNERVPGNSQAENSGKSIVPEGLSGQTVSNDADVLTNEISAVAKGTPQTTSKTSDSDAAGFVAGDKIKPANGSFLHLESGTIIPPASDSVFDTNTQSFISSPSNGSVARDGEFVPPANMTISEEGKIELRIATPEGKTKIVELGKPAPVFSATAPSLTDIVNTITQNPVFQNVTGPIALDPVPVITQPSGTTTVPATGGIDQTTSILQQKNSRVNINVLR